MTTPGTSLNGVGPAAAVGSEHARRSVWAYVAFTGVVFGTSGLVAKALVDDGVDPFIVTWIPFLSGGLFGLAFAHRRGELRRDALVPALWLGATAGAAPALLFNIGFENLSAGIVTLMISLGPVITAAVAPLVFSDERFSRVKAVGLVLAVSGVAVLSTGALEGDSSVGVLFLVLLGAVAAGTSAVLTRVYAMSHGAAALIAPQLATAGVIALVLSPMLGRPMSPAGGYEPWHVPAMVAFGLGIYFGFLSLLRANEVGTTGQVSVTFYCVPVFGVIGGIVLFGDDLTLALVVGALLILLSVTLIAAGSRPGAIRA